MNLALYHYSNHYVTREMSEPKCFGSDIFRELLSQLNNAKLKTATKNCSEKVYTD